MKLNPEQKETLDIATNILGALVVYDAIAQGANFVEACKRFQAEFDRIYTKYEIPLDKPDPVLNEPLGEFLVVLGEIMVMNRDEDKQEEFGEV